MDKKKWPDDGIGWPHVVQERLHEDLHLVVVGEIAQNLAKILVFILPFVSVSWIRYNPDPDPHFYKDLFEIGNPIVWNMGKLAFCICVGVAFPSPWKKIPLLMWRNLPKIVCKLSDILYERKSAKLCISAASKGTSPCSLADFFCQPTHHNPLQFKHMKIGWCSENMCISRVKHV